VSPLTKEDLQTIQELIKTEVEILFKPILDSLKDIYRALNELRARTEENTKAIAELRLAIAELKSRTEENTKAIAELRARTEENTKAIAELRSAIIELRAVTEENTKAIIELRSRTEENIKAIAELRIRTEENTKAIAELRETVAEMRKILLSHDIMLKRLGKAVGGLGRSLGSLLEDSVRRGLKNWLITNGYVVNQLEPKIIDNIEFDLYIDAIKGNRRLKVIGEIKQTITPKKVENFALKLEKLSMKDFEALMVFKRIKKKNSVIEKAKIKKIYLLYHLGDDVFVSYKLGDLF